MVEIDSGVDRDNEKCTETQRVTARDWNAIQCNSMFL
jgi:hypothetical protein